MSKASTKLLLLSAAMLLSSCGGKQTTSSSNEVITSLEEQTSLSPEETSSEAPVVTSSPVSSGSESESSGDTPVSGNRTLRIAYHNDANTQSDLAIYLWADGLNGILYNWDGNLDENFAYIDVKLDEDPFVGYCDETIYFIIRPKATWTGQSTDTTVTLSEFEFLPIEGGTMATAYCCEGPGGSVEVYTDMKEALGNKFSSLEISSDLKTLSYTATASPVFVNVYVFDKTFYDYSDEERYKHRHDYLKVTLDNPKIEQSFTLESLGESEFDPHKTYMITGAFSDNIGKVRTKFLNMRPLFDTKGFIEKYTYSGHDLGCEYNGEDKSTTFKVWAPTTARVQAVVYKSPTPRTINRYSDTYHYSNDEVVAKIDLEDLGQGVWGGTYKDKDLAGYGYIYRLYRDGSYTDVVDPYAHASGANSKRAAILDFDTTDPENFEESFENLPTLSSPNKLSVYEVHVRDLTSHETWNGTSQKGTYGAFTEKGTTYQGVKTGFDHILDFGVEAVQLLPVFDQDNDERTYDKTINGVETHFEPAFNWGYNPQLYAVPEGSYSTDPYRPEVRVKEYKQLIKDCADNGLRVIMDVVYNHVASVTSNPLNHVVPGYYFQYDDEGFLIDHTGCGNTTASSRVMMANFMVDTVSWWAKEYGVKGFRYDLMGALDYKAMRMVKDALYGIDPEIVVYGEPWSTSGVKLNEVYSELKDNGKGAVGAFNNGGRDGLKGDTTYANVTPSYGFMNTGIDYMNSDIKRKADAAFMGWNPFSSDYGKNDPAQTVNYVSCHDNYTLFDQLNYTLRQDGKDAYNLDDEVAKHAKMGAVATLAANFLSQGMGFIQGGDEFFRYKIMSEDDEMFEELVESYKQGSYTHDDGHVDTWIEGDGIALNNGQWLVRNSYKYGDKVNGFNYALLAENTYGYSKVKEALSLRKSMMGSLFGKSKSEITSGKASMWGTVADGQNPTDPIIAAYYRNDKESRNYYVVLSGREGTETYNDIPINNIAVGKCTIKIAYSSNDYHEVGQECECTTTMGARDFELMLCYMA
ncbi:MAG: hypothetical protein K6B65_04800 [Bacilli bacterium]|nr:hypothetical protein [Bacilli bacterium]